MRRLGAVARRWCSGGCATPSDLVNHDLPTSMRRFTPYQRDMDKRVAARLKEVARGFSHRTGSRRADRHHIALRIVAIIKEAKRAGGAGLFAYNTAIAGLGRLRELVSMHEVVGMMDVQPDRTTWTMLATAYAAAGDDERALGAFEAALRHGVVPGRQLLGIKLKVASRRGDITTCLAVLETMRRGHPRDHPLPMHVLDAAKCCTTPAQLEQLLAAHVDIIPEDAIVRINALLELYARQIRRRRASPRGRDDGEDTADPAVSTQSLLDAMADAYTTARARRGALCDGCYTAVLSAYKACGEYAKALAAWDDMMADGVTPDTVACCAALHVCVLGARQRDDAFFAKAEAVFDVCSGRGDAVLGSTVPWAMLMRLYSKTGAGERAERLMGVVLDRYPNVQRDADVAAAYETATRRRWRPQRVPVSLSAEALKVPRVDQSAVKSADDIVMEVAAAWRTDAAARGQAGRGFRSAAQYHPRGGDHT